MEMKNSSFNETIGHIMKTCISDIIGSESVGTIMENSHFVDMAVEKANSEKKNITNLNITSEKTEINPKNKTQLSDRKDNAKKKIGGVVIKSVIEQISGKYSGSLLSHFGPIGEKISGFSQDFDNLTPDFLDQNLSPLFQNPLFDISFDEWEIIKNNNQPALNCYCRLDFAPTAKQPVAIISLNPSLGQNPFMKMKFKIGGHITIPSMQIQNLNNFNVSLREFDATLGISLKEISAMDFDLKLRDDVIYTFAEKTIHHEFY